MNAYEIPDIDPQPREADGHGYVDFLASEKLSVGLAIWPAGSIDRRRDGHAGGKPDGGELPHRPWLGPLRDRRSLPSQLIYLVRESRDLHMEETIPFRLLLRA